MPSIYKKKKKSLVAVLPNEIWKDIPGYEDNYQISSLGRFKMKKQQFITWGSGKNGEYKRIILHYNEKKKYKRVHQLVALLFIENPDKKKQVNHLDGNKSNNAWWNLEWATQKENNEHALRIGLKIPYRKISNEIVLELRNSILTDKELSLKYRIDYKYVWAIRKSKARLLI